MPKLTEVSGPKVGVVTFPISEAGNVPLSQLIEILSREAGVVSLLTGGSGYARFKDDARVSLTNVRHRPAAGGISRMASHLWTQLEIAVLMAKSSPEVGQWIFFIGGEALFFPMLLARLSRKRTILVFPGSNYQTYVAAEDRLSQPLRLLARATGMLSDRMLVYTPRLIKEYGLEDFGDKVQVARRHFIDTSAFRPTTPLHERDRAIGFIGRLSEEKGVMRLVEAFAMVPDREVEMRIVGDGQLRGRLEAFVRENGLEGRVKLLGWVSHDQLGDHLNRLRLLVIPSFTEGLPNIMLEAMACGTPVLAARVGSVPDVIEDGSTGYLMDDNEVETIRKGIVRALEDENGERVGEKGRIEVTSNYCLESALDSWRPILEKGG